MITREEVKQAILEQEAAREKALAQANFHAGFLTALRQVEERLAGDQAAAEFPEDLDVKPETLPAEELAGKNGRKRDK